MHFEGVVVKMFFYVSLFVVDPLVFSREVSILLLMHLLKLSLVNVLMNHLHLSLQETERIG